MLNALCYKRLSHSITRYIFFLAAKASTISRVVIYVSQLVSDQMKTMEPEGPRRSLKDPENTEGPRKAQ